MKHLLILLCALAVRDAFAANPRVEMQTNVGKVIVELYPDKAPRTVANFLDYVKSGFYEGTIFHRVVKGFVAQAGAFDQMLNWHPPAATPIPNEAKNGLTNEPGTLAMAHDRDPDSATSQFFFNLESNKHLNHYRDEPAYFGNCVFGKVVKGMDVLHVIGDRPTGAGGPFAEDVPLEPVVIEKIALLPEEDAPKPQPKSKRKGKSNGKTKDQPRRHLAGT